MADGRKLIADSYDLFDKFSRRFYTFSRGVKMKKNNWYLSLLMLLLVALVVFSASCITVYDKKPSDSKPGSPSSPSTPSATGAPVIKSFSALPTAVNAGQQSQLKWEVTSATSVEVNPVVGKVDAVSMAMVSPTATTTYTLTATNASGKATATVVVNVAAGVANRPDLIITDIWITNKEVYYKVKNIGKETAKAGSRSSFHVNGIQYASDYVETLDPGQERTSPFPNYSWVYDLSGTADQWVPSASEGPKQFILKVCADTANTVAEVNESNNCKTVVMGTKFNYPFDTFAHQAAWTTGYGPLKLPLPDDSATGAALVSNLSLEDGQSYGAAMLTIPQKVNDGWITGRFGVFYTDRDTRATMVQDVEILETSKFSAMVGFARDTAPNSKAKFTFSFVDQSGVPKALSPITKSNDKKLALYEVDLSQFAGQKGTFLFRVDAIGSADNIRPVWVDAKVYQP